MNLNINLADLKAKTEQAIQKGAEEALRIQQEKDAMKAAADAKMKAEAEEIIAQIPGLCERAAEKGQNEVLIMKEKAFFKSSFEKGGWKAKITGGAALLVIEACQKAGLKIDVRHIGDGVGMNSWADIYVAWN